MIVPQAAQINIDTQTPLNYFNTVSSWMDRARQRDREEQQDSILRPVVEAKARLELATIQDRISALAQTQNMVAEAHEKMPTMRQQFHDMLNSPVDTPNRYQALSNFVGQMHRYSGLSERVPELQGMMQAAVKELEFMEFQRRKQFEWDNSPGRPVSGGNPQQQLAAAQETSLLWQSIGQDPSGDRQKARQAIRAHETALEQGNRTTGGFLGMGGRPRTEAIAESQQRLRAALDRDAMNYRTLMQSGNATEEEVRSHILRMVSSGQMNEEEAAYIAKQLGLL